jgi:hypothetical protein
MVGFNKRFSHSLGQERSSAIKLRSRPCAAIVDQRVYRSRAVEAHALIE